jgi:hypothetical protein
MARMSQNYPAIAFWPPAVSVSNFYATGRFVWLHKVERNGLIALHQHILPTDPEGWSRRRRPNEFAP